MTAAKNDVAVTAAMHPRENVHALALILRFFTEFDRFSGGLYHSG